MYPSAISRYSLTGVKLRNQCTISLNNDNRSNRHKIICIHFLPYSRNCFFVSFGKIYTEHQWIIIFNIYQEFVLHLRNSSQETFVDEVLLVIGSDGLLNDTIQLFFIACHLYKNKSFRVGTWVLWFWLLKYLSFCWMWAYLILNQYVCRQSLYCFLAFWHLPKMILSNHELCCRLCWCQWIMLPNCFQIYVLDWQKSHHQDRPGWRIGGGLSDTEDVLW